MGFTTTMIFLKIRRDVTERQVFSVEAVSKFAGIVGQVCFTFFILLLLFIKISFIYLDWRNYGKFDYFNFGFV